MLISKLIAARIAYGVDRAVQANAGSPVLVKTWEKAIAAHPTWLRYITNWQQRGASPALDAGGIRDAAFAAALAVIAPRREPGQVSGKTVNFTLSPTTYAHTGAGGTQQLTITNAVDVDGDAVPSEHYTYTSSNPAHATVSSTGLITTVAAGAATITATSSSGIAKTCAVTVS